MARRGLNIYRRQDGRYEGRYKIGHRLSGRPHFGYIYGRAYGEVVEPLILARAAALPGASLIIIGKGSLREYLDYWMTEIMRNKVKQSTYSRYYERIHGYIIPALGQTPLFGLSKEQVQNFVDGLSKKGLASSTVCGIGKLLHSALKKAKELNFTHENPCEDVSYPTVTVKETRPLNRDEQIEVEQLAVEAGKSLELGVFLSLYTGLRIGDE